MAPGLTDDGPPDAKVSTPDYARSSGLTLVFSDVAPQHWITTGGFPSAQHGQSMKPSSRHLRLVLFGTALTALSYSLQAAVVPGQGTWETTLQARDLTGDGVADAYYDTSLNITWLRNWDVNGSMTADVAKAWAESLAVGGFGGWRLPRVNDSTGFNCSQFGDQRNCGYPTDISASELAHMYYVTLGNLPRCTSAVGLCEPRAGGGLTNTANLEIQDAAYWSSEVVQAATMGGTDGVWYFVTSGSQGVSGPSARMSAVAVRNGDVGAAIPEPATYGLALIALVMLGLTTRHRKH